MALVGVNQAVRNLQRWAEGAEDGVMRQLESELNRVLERSQVYVPVDTGKLKASGQVNGPAYVGDEIAGSVTYGDDVAFYALIVHERLDVYHKPPTQAKYLERAYQEQRRGMEGRLAIAARRAARRRAGL